MVSRTVSAADLASMSSALSVDVSPSAFSRSALARVSSSSAAALYFSSVDVSPSAFSRSALARASSSSAAALYFSSVSVLSWYASSSFFASSDLAASRSF